ncbi:hypothetical protein MUG84_05650 [Paenibacillus sp. KQZ6P-2]|uniref:Uncharacterized protein n=1 Tax=Paenibacillus mangrovi TaxID=2931978 RepID=A0A9X1WMJ2_9BACL|nr:hypothetical protein [Paenibacillus mangrovi]MCJ8011231.1 hypothetical protein [Paenibacillus mangrovi]
MNNRMKAGSIGCGNIGADILLNVLAHGRNSLRLQTHSLWMKCYHAFIIQGFCYVKILHNKAFFINPKKQE